MVFRGLKKKKDRADLVAHLKRATAQDLAAQREALAEADRKKADREKADQTKARAKSAAAAAKDVRKLALKTCVTVLTFPMAALTMQLQCAPPALESQDNIPTSFLALLDRMYAARGLSAFFAGVVPTVLATVSSHFLGDSLRRTCYPKVRAALGTTLGSRWCRFVAGTLADLLVAAAVHPLRRWCVTRSVLNSSSGRDSSEELYAGLGVFLLGRALYRGAWYAGYVLYGHTAERHGNVAARGFSIGLDVVCSALAYPLRTVCRRRMLGAAPDDSRLYADVMAGIGLHVAHVVQNHVLRTSLGFVLGKWG